MNVLIKIMDANKQISRRRGVVAIWFVLMLPVMIGFVGLTIETGHLIWVGQQLQIGADASALAAAQIAKNGIEDARTRAVDTGLANEARREPIQLDRNDANAPEGDIVFGRFNREFRTFDGASPAVNAVKVVARRTDTSLGGPVPTLFARIFGIDTVNMQRVAIAMTGGGTGAGMMALDPKAECALEVSGDTTTLVTGADGTGSSGAIQVNSDNDGAACFRGSVDIETGDINIVGYLCVIGGAAVYPDETQAPPLPDPLWFLEDPTTNGCVDMTTDLGTIDMQGGEIKEIGPGYYSGGITINNGTLTLTTGIYVLGGVGLHVTGSANLFAGLGPPGLPDDDDPGVMLYIIDPGCVEIQGTGQVVIKEPDADYAFWDCIKDYEFVSIFQARDNYCEALIIGTGDFLLEGSIYFPVAHARLGGDGAKLGNQFIAWTIEIFGNGEVTIDYDGRFPAPGVKSYLVF